MGTDATSSAMNPTRRSRGHLAVCMAVAVTWACAGERFGDPGQDSTESGATESGETTESTDVDADGDRPEDDVSGVDDAGAWIAVDASLPPPEPPPTKPTDGAAPVVRGDGARGEHALPDAASAHPAEPPPLLDVPDASWSPDDDPCDAGKCDASSGWPSRDASDAGDAASDASDAGAVVDAGCGDIRMGDECVCNAGEHVGLREDCYYFGRQALDFSAAREACRARGEGWDLADVRSRTEDEFIVSHLRGDTWIGASDAEQSDVWRWVNDGAVFWLGTSTGQRAGTAYVNWAEGEPTGGVQGDECARYREEVGYRWADTDCANTHHYACRGPQN